MKPWLPGLALLAWMLGVPAPASAQNRSSIKIEAPTVSNFEAPIAGEDGRRVALVSGAKATPSLVSEQVEVTLFRLETYRYAPDRITEIIVESPVARFGRQGAASGERLTLKSADDRFAIGGVGWSWSRGTGLLVISNAVETTLRRGTEETNRAPIQVRAGRFEYNLRSGDARYLGDCMAEDPGRARVSAGELISRLSPRQSQPEAIVATNGVVIDLLRPGKPGRAEGGDAIYTAATETRGERIELNGKPTWRFGPGEGAAEQLVLVPGEEAYTARGHARLRWVAPGKETNGIPATEGTRGAIEIQCEVIEARSTNVVFTGPLVARQGDRLEIRASRLEASHGPDPKTQETAVHFARATGDVAARVGIGPQAIELRGETMAYTPGEPSWIEVEGNPSWRGVGHTGKAQRFVLNPEGPMFEATGDVQVRWAPESGGTNATPVDLTSATLRVDGARATFAGGVDAVGARWNLKASEMDLVLATNRVIRGFEARREVRLLYEMALARTSTNAPSRAVLRAFTELSTVESRRWEITAETLQAELAPGTDELLAMEATGGVDIRHPALKAHGGRLTYSAMDPLFRLRDDAELRAVDGLEVLAGPSSALTVDPRTGRAGVEGPVRRMVLPARALRETASTNAAARPR